MVRPDSRVNAAPWRRPMFAAAPPRFVSLTLLATSKLALPRRYANLGRIPWMRSQLPGVIFRRPSPKRPAQDDAHRLTGIGAAGSVHRIGGEVRIGEEIVDGRREN